jgi:hypothetical protein
MYWHKKKYTCCIDKVKKLCPAITLPFFILTFCSHQGLTSINTGTFLSEYSTIECSESGSKTKIQAFDSKDSIAEKRLFKI